MAEMKFLGAATAPFSADIPDAIVPIHLFDGTNVRVMPKAMHVTMMMKRRQVWIIYTQFRRDKNVNRLPVDSFTKG